MRQRGRSCRGWSGPRKIQPWDVAVSPDARLVAVSYGPATGDEAAVPATGDQVAIILFDPDSGEVVSRITAAPGDYSVPSFSPDGELIAATDR